MFVMIRNYIRRAYYALKFVGSPNWMRRMDLLLHRENIEYHVRRRERTASQLLTYLVSGLKITPEELDGLRANLLRTGFMDYSEAAEANMPFDREKYEALLQQAVRFGSLEEEDVATLLSELDGASEIDARSIPAS